MPVYRYILHDEETYSMAVRPLPSVGSIPQWYDLAQYLPVNCMQSCTVASVRVDEILGAARILLSKEARESQNSRWEKGQK